MRTELCDRFGIDYPIFVFTPSEKVAAAVSRAGGLGVLGCVRFNDADDLENVLCWMDENIGGKPYGVDLVMPAKVPQEGTDLSRGNVGGVGDGHEFMRDRVECPQDVEPLTPCGGPQGTPIYRL